MKLEDWQKGLDAWNRIKTQAEIDIEQANLYIKAIKEKINEVKQNGK